MAGWSTTWATSEGRYKLLKPSLNELRSALVERIAVVNQGYVPSQYQPPSAISSNDIITTSWFTQFDTSIDFALYYFAYYDDTNKKIELYNPATMLSKLGDASFVDTPKDPQLCATWMWQRYRMLNLLTQSYEEWFNGSARVSSGLDMPNCVMNKKGSNILNQTWADAISSARSASWQTTTNYGGTSAGWFNWGVLYDNYGWSEELPLGGSMTNLQFDIIKASTYQGYAFALESYNVAWGSDDDATIWTSKFPQMYSAYLQETWAYNDNTSKAVETVPKTFYDTDTPYEPSIAVDEIASQNIINASLLNYKVAGGFQYVD